MKQSLTISLSIVLGFIVGMLVRNEMGFTAKMPEFDSPPTPTPIISEEVACTTEWTDNEKIVNCKKYKVLRYNN